MERKQITALCTECAFEVERKKQKGRSKDGKDKTADNK